MILLITAVIVIAACFAIIKVHQKNNKQINEKSTMKTELFYYPDYFTPQDAKQEMQDALVKQRRNTLGLLSKKKLAKLFKRRSVIAGKIELIEGKLYIKIGKSECSFDDQFNKAEGRKLALENAENKPLTKIIVAANTSDKMLIDAFVEYAKTV